jgi:hypothetical protein
MKKTSLIAVLSILLVAGSVQAKEGMWIPLLIEKLNYDDLKANGFKLTAEDIYSINQACLKDAVVIFGGGCTGEMISSNGLLLTNHHCGYNEIQQHSTLENNYLKEGFWAASTEEELPNDDLDVLFLVEIKEYTHEIFNNLNKGADLEEERIAIEVRIDSLEGVISDSLNMKASIEKFFYGNDYYLFLYNQYTDVRLVGAPPNTIGNFGGDTDNWVWPRHTGDFSLFRVYSGPDGKPADYSKENIPYTPKKHLTISAKGIKENDFTMVLGYPGKTQEYLYSAGLEIIASKIYPGNIALRDGRIEIIDQARRNDDKVYIQYASKHRRVSNAWKKWEGVLYGFNRFNVIEKRKNYETWLLENAGNKKAALQELFGLFDDAYVGYEPYAVAKDYYRESAFAIEPVGFYIRKIAKHIPQLAEKDKKDEVLTRIKKAASLYFKDYNIEIDKSLTTFLLQEYRNNLGEEFQASTIVEKSSAFELEKYIETLYEKSILTDSNRFKRAVRKLADGDLSAFNDDPFIMLANEFNQVNTLDVLEGYNYYADQLNNLYKEYLPMIQAIDTTRPIYPDANFTMRMTYGKVEGYSPRDAVNYNYQTYLQGIIDKESLGYHDYDVPEKLKQLYYDKDYGRYAAADGRLPVCFVASNHTSGGNSGSPILDAEGRLIGINFDRTWEGTMSDFNFDEEICRNISVDIRYVLFIIDKFADSGYLLEEMDIIW